MMSFWYKIFVQLFYSVMFALCESAFYYATAGYFHTTLEQFVLSFALSPFIIQIDRMMTAYGCNFWFRILLYPFLFWIFEIVGGFTLLYYFGKNNAWAYNTPDAVFFGTVRLFYYPLFLLMGILLHCIDMLLIL